MIVRSLIDLGYTVNVALADVFFVIMAAASLLEQPTGTIALGDDVIRDLIRGVDDRGALVRVLRPPER